MKRLFLAIMLCTCTFVLWAVPAKRITITVEQPDGTTLTLTAKGDEHFHYWETEDGLIALRRNQGYYYAHIVEDKVVPSEHLAHALNIRSEEELLFTRSLPTLAEMHEARLTNGNKVQKARTRAQNNGEVPTKGVVHVPVLLVQYADKKFSSTTAKKDFEEHLNGEEYNRENSGYGSAKKYFEDQSDGKFSPQLDIIGPVTLSQNMSYYGGNDDEGNDLRPREMVREACQLANEGTDFSKYDNNKDGYVDIVYVIYAGYGEASSQLENTIWPHQWNLAAPLSLDNVKISKYACNNELEYSNEVRLAGIGTFCHEFSHCLGLPDFYSTGEAQTFGMDAWSLMDYGCYNDNGHTPCGYTGYEKEFLGWRDLIALENPADLTMKPLSEGGDAYKIVNDANQNEFYVLENHKKTKWDSGAAAEGMLIIHVDYLESAWASNTLNNDPTHLRMTVIPADNMLSKNTIKGDTYPGTSNNTELTDKSSPAAKVYKGGTMGKDITNIALNNGVISFSFMKGALLAPQNTNLTDITNSSFCFTWDKVAEAEEYEVQLEYLEENPYLLDEDFDKVKKGNHDIGASLGSYTNNEGWIGQKVYGLDGAIRVGNTSSVGAIKSPNFTCDSSSVTIILGFKKSEKSDTGAKILLGIGDQEWGNSLIGGYLTATNENWETCIAVIDSIGKHPYFYLDTRGDAAQGLGTRADIDYIYLLPGNKSKELTGNTGSNSAASMLPKSIEEIVRKHIQHTRPVSLSCAERHDPMFSLQCTTAKDANDQYTSPNGKHYYKQVIHTARTTDTSYLFEDLDSGRYACAVRSICGEIYSRYTSRKEIELSGDNLPTLEVTPYIYIDKDSLYMEVKDSVILYYTTDGTQPTKYGNRYDAPLYLGSKTRTRVVAYQKGYKSTAPIEKVNWFKQGDATYRIISEVTPEVSLSETVDGNTKADYVGHRVVEDSVEHNDISFAIVGIDSATFSNATALRSVKIAGRALRSIGNNLFYGCSALNAVEWDIDLPIDAEMFDETSYYNLLVYVPEGIDFNHSLIEAKRMSLIEGGKTKYLQLNPGKPLYIPRAFTAESVSYQRTFTQTTGDGDAAGWETIVLPFDVQLFTHPTKGEIVPFGIEAKHNFWLAELTGEGFKPTTSIRANTPYIIAMPNNTEYGENSISGNISFSANQTIILPTSELTESESTEFKFIPTYETVAPQDGVYALNVGSKYETHKAGSIFVPNRYTTAPFAAYIVPIATHQAAPFYRIQKEDDMENVNRDFSVKSHEGTVYVFSPESKEILVHDITGRMVCRIACAAGITEITGLSEGIYLIENIKIFVKR